VESIGVGTCYASFGELLQGVLPGGHKFLVNCRIRNSSTVTVRLSDPSYQLKKEEDLALAYARFPKTCKGLRIFLGDLGRHDDCLVSVESDIPIGKGLSSSTADMVAGVRGLAQALSLKLKNDYVSRVLTDVEPNDGLHFDHTSAYHHTEGRLIANVDWVPPLNILGIDEGGVLDTVAFNRREIAWTDQQTERYRELLDAMLTSLAARDHRRVAELATQSARAWQSISPKRDLDAVLGLADDSQALGVINTHSGTYLGLLFADDAALDRDRLAEIAAERLPGRAISWFQTTGCAQVQSAHAREKRHSFG
jgi:L-threonine kinase